MKKIVLMVGLVVAITSSSAHGELLAWLKGDKVNGPEPRILLDYSDKGNHAAATPNTVINLDEGNEGGAVDFGDDGASWFNFNTNSEGAFDSITDNQSFTIAYWMAGDESAEAPRNQSTFWFQSPGNNGGERGIQSHAPWSNGQVYLDIGGCCSGTQRVNGAIDRDFWDSTVGDEYTHYAYTMDEFGLASVFIDGAEVLFRDGPTDTINPFSTIWFGSAVNGGNSFAGRMDDIVIADEALSLDDVFTLFEEGPAAVWPDDVISGDPPDVEPLPPFIPPTVVDGFVIVSNEVVDGVTVGTVDDFTQYQLTIDGDTIDMDHILPAEDTTLNTKLDLTDAKIKVDIQGEFVVGDDFVPFFAKEVVGLDTVIWDFPDRGLFSEDKFNQDGGWRLTYVGDTSAGEALASIPEPAGLSILGLGSCLLLVLRRRRK